MNLVEATREHWIEVRRKSDRAGKSDWSADDSEFLETKLRGYELVCNLSTLQAGDHLRITWTKYRQPGRKCCYIILKRYDTEKKAWWVNGYRSEQPDWLLPVQSTRRYKQLRFYRIPRLVHTGACETCSRTVKKPYLTCYGCRK